MSTHRAEPVEYVNCDGHSLFGQWFNGLNAPAAARITTALTRMQEGKLSQVRSVGGGVSEFKVDFVPGYRIYFGMDGVKVIVLLCGGTKKGQEKDIERVKALWKEYKIRKKTLPRED